MSIEADKFLHFFILMGTNTAMQGFLSKAGLQELQQKAAKYWSCSTSLNIFWIFMSEAELDKSFGLIIKITREKSRYKIWDSVIANLSLNIKTLNLVLLISAPEWLSGITHF